MKILQVVNTLDATDGGPARNSFEVNQALNNLPDLSALIWAVHGVHLGSTVDADERAGRSVGVPYPVFAGRASRFLSEIRACDVVVIHGFYLWWVPLVILAANLLKKPFVIMPHGAISPYEMRKSSIRKRIFDEAARLAGVRGARFAVGSESERTDVLRRRSDANVAVVGVGTALPGGTLQERPRRTHLLLLSVCRIASKKRIDLSIDALACTLKLGIPATLTIAGDGSPELKAELFAQAERLGVADAVNFVGHVDAEEKASLFREADVFLLPSEDENFGISVAEALSYGTPAIVSDRVAAAHEVHGDAIQMLADPSGESMATAIVAWADPSALAAARARAWAEARRVFDWAAVAQRWLEVLQAAHGRGENAPAGTIIYVSTSYPSYSETFVSAEMEHLRSVGWNVLSYSLRKPPAELDHAVPYVVRPAGRLLLSPWILLGLAMRFTRWRNLPRLRNTRSIRSALRGVFLDAHAARLSRAIASIGTEVTGVHAHFFAQPAEVAARAAGRLPVVVTVHAADASVEPSVENLRFIRRITGFRFASHAVERTFQTVGVPTRSIVLPCVASLPPERKSLSAKDSVVRVITVARLVTTKGYRRMMGVLEKASERGRVEWTIVGDGPLREEIERWISRHESPRLHVRLMGAQPHAETLSLLSNADVFLLLPEETGDSITKGDGLPVALMEAMASGVPIVSSSAGGITELVRPGVTGIVVGPTDDKTVIESVWAANRTAASARIVDAGRDLVAKSFSPESTTAVLSEWLHETLESPKAPVIRSHE